MSIIVLVPSEAPFVEGRRYRDSGAVDARKLALYIEDPAGDYRRAHGVLIRDPLPPQPKLPGTSKP